MKTLDTAIDFLIENIKADYLSWTLACSRRNADNGKDGLSEVNERMIAEFDNSIKVTKGKKYIKIIKEGGGVWGFIVATDDDKKFTRGTILKPAGWAAPARNHSRGNVLDGGYTVQWTGPLYM